MAKRREGTIRYIAREIREEAEHQLRGFPREVKHQLTDGWGQEFARQIFATPRHRRRGR